MTSFTLSQIFAGTALASDLISFQCKDRQKIIIFLFASCVLLSVHFFLLQQVTAGTVVLLSAVRLALSYLTTSRKIMWTFLLATLIACALTYGGPLSILSTTAALIQTYASFRARDKQLRQFMMIGSTLWMIHNVLVWTPVAILNQILFISSNIVGYYRFHVKAQQDLPSEKG